MELLPLFTLYAFMVCMGTTLHILPRLYLYHKDELYINKKIPVIPVYLYSCKLTVWSPSCLSQYQAFCNLVYLAEFSVQ